MHLRALFATVEALKSRMLHAWAAGWSVPTDQVFISARLPPRHVDAQGGVAERWLLKAARSAAVKWRGEVCGVHRGEIQSAVIAGFGLPQQAPLGIHGTVQVTARYCGRIPGGGFCFRHGLCDARGSEILHFISQIHFDPPPDLPAYPALKFDSDDGSRDLDQAFTHSAMADTTVSGNKISQKSTYISVDTNRHIVTSDIS